VHAIGGPWTFPNIYGIKKDMHFPLAVIVVGNLPFLTIATGLFVSVLLVCDALIVWPGCRRGVLFFTLAAVSVFISFDLYHSLSENYQVAQIFSAAV